MLIPTRGITDKTFIGSIISVIFGYLLIRVFTTWYSRYLEKKEEELKEKENIGELY
ncbi:hypothetical protein [Thermococcus sibiricus]|uniref:Uncharacterized protein n=1 Tax=Thermococcus sibiricus TaxID=172049 RepID=A0A101EMX8_9EURY|nr:hypothetical protein [Thermococcus sibiricus]KUK18312.1 MAG: Uncharacterized protein XD54_0403 [Thermococcus sibiricus]